MLGTKYCYFVGHTFPLCYILAGWSFNESNIFVVQIKSL